MAVVNRLVECGANVNALPSQLHGRTALQAAAAGGHLDFVNQLIGLGASIYTVTTETCGRSSSEKWALNISIVDRLLEYVSVFRMFNQSHIRYPVVASLQAAARRGHQAIVDRLLKLRAGFDVDEMASGTNRTALQAAAGSGSLNSLLECGASANMKPAQIKGRTALQAAAESGCLDIVNKLLELGVQVNEDPAEIEAERHCRQPPVVDT